MNLGNHMAAMMSHPKMSNQPDSRTGTSLLDWGVAVEGLGPELTPFLGNEGEFWVDTSHRADMNCQGLRYPRAVAALKESWVIHRKLCPRGLFRVLSVKGSMVQIWRLEENVRKRLGSLWCLVHTWSMARRVRLWSLSHLLHTWSVVGRVSSQ